MKKEPPPKMAPASEKKPPLPPQMPPHAPPQAPPQAPPHVPSLMTHSMEKHSEVPPDPV